MSQHGKELLLKIFRYGKRTLTRAAKCPSRSRGPALSLTLKLLAWKQRKNFFQPAQNIGTGKHRSCITDFFAEMKNNNGVPNKVHRLREFMMAVKYFIDESGHSGDLINSGKALDFDGPPIFSLACFGVSDETRLDGAIARLTSKQQITALELKSSSLLRQSDNTLRENCRIC